MNVLKNNLASGPCFFMTDIICMLLFDLLRQSMRAVRMSSTMTAGSMSAHLGSQQTIVICMNSSLQEYRKVECKVS
jgi:hypothetical protein